MNFSVGTHCTHLPWKVFAWSFLKHKLEDLFQTEEMLTGKNEIKRTYITPFFSFLGSRTLAPLGGAFEISRNFSTFPMPKTPVYILGNEYHIFMHLNKLIFTKFCLCPSVYTTHTLLLILLCISTCTSEYFQYAVSGFWESLQHLMCE